MAKVGKKTIPISKLREPDKDQKAINLVMNRWSTLESDMSTRKSDYASNKNFFLAKENEMYDEDERSGENRRPVPYSSMITLYYRDLLASKTPEFRAIPPDLAKGVEDEEEKTLLERLAHEIGDSSEKVVRLAWDLNDMDLKFPDAALDAGSLGDAFLRLLWDPDDKRGGKKGTPVLDFVAPSRVRIGWKDNNWRKIEYFITSKRISLTAAKSIYGVEASPDDFDTETTGTLEGWGSTPEGGKDFPTAGDAELEGDKTQIPMVTVYNYWDEEKNIVIVGTDKVVRNVKHGYGFCPIFHIPNLRIPNEPWGYPDHYWVTGVTRSINELHDKARGIIKYQAGPIVLDIGNSLKGKQLPAGNSVVVPIPVGNTMQYLQWAGNLYPVLNQIKEEKEALFAIQGLPANITATSGFMVQVQMVKALMRAETKKKNWEAAFRWMCRGVLQLVQKFDKTSLPKGVENLQFKIKWPEVLPQDEARIYQNLAIGKRLDILSDYTSIEKLGIESPFDEIRKIEDEKRRKAKLEAELEAMLQAAMPQPAPEGVQPMPVPPIPTPPTGGELVQNVPGRLEEEMRELPGAEERVAPTSLMGT